jgi:carboxyl-terminal processing protease
MRLTARQAAEPQEDTRPNHFCRALLDQGLRGDWDRHPLSLAPPVSGSRLSGLTTLRLSSLSFDAHTQLYYPNCMALGRMKRWSLPVVSILVIGTAAAAGGYITRPVHVKPTEPNVQEDMKSDFREALETIEDNYAGAADLELLGKNSMQGMLRTLDPHSTFFTKSEYDDLQAEQRSHYYGIGVDIKKVYNRVYVLSANPDGPGYRAGLRYGDAVIAVNGQPAESWSGEEVTEKVRGAKGEPVTLTIERPGVGHPISLKIIRDEVKLPTVRLSFMIGQAGTGYVGLTGGFSGKTNEELATALTRLKQQGMRQLILDLRGNPGGLLDQAIRVAEKFLPAGEKILEVRGRDEQLPDRVYEAADNNEPETMPMVILINQGTASASEVVAGALQDHSRAYIVGENSFGKGLVQGIYTLWGGTGLLLTTQRYYTPSGRSIQRDYSKISFYDYYRNRHGDVTEAVKAEQPFYTDLGQTVYGGGGIAPNERVKSQDSSPLSNRLFGAAFDFVRQLATGQIAGFHEYKITGAQRKTIVSAEDINAYPITDKLVAALRAYIDERPQFSVSEATFNANLDYIKSRLRSEIITAAYGAEAGEEVFLYDDVQVKKALEVLPEAKQLAENSLRANREHQ